MSCRFVETESALKNSVAKMMTPTSMPATSPAMSASGNSTGGMDLSPNSLAHSAMALHGLRGPTSALASLTHGAGMDLNSSLSGRTSPIPTGLTYGATLAHFMSAQSSLNQRNLASHMAQQHQQHQQQQQQLHPSPVLVKSEKNSGSACVSKSLSSTQLGGHNNNSTSNGMTPSPMDDNSTPSAGHGLSGSGIPTLAAYSLPAHSVYELAALTQELDTQGMTTKIKEVLLANNIGQKVHYYYLFIFSLTLHPSSVFLCSNQNEFIDSTFNCLYRSLARLCWACRKAPSLNCCPSRNRGTC